MWHNFMSAHRFTNRNFVDEKISGYGEHEFFGVFDAENERA